MPSTAPVLRNDKPSIRSLSAIHLSSGVRCSNASASVSLSRSVSSNGGRALGPPGISSINAWMWVRGRTSEVQPITLGNPADAIHAKEFGS